MLYLMMISASWSTRQFRFFWLFLWHVRYSFLCFCGMYAIHFCVLMCVMYTVYFCVLMSDMYIIHFYVLIHQTEFRFYWLHDKFQEVTQLGEISKINPVMLAHCSLVLLSRVLSAPCLSVLCPLCSFRDWETIVPLHALDKTAQCLVKVRLP